MKRLFIFLIAFASFEISYSQNLTFFGFLPSVSQTGIISSKFDYNVFASATNSEFSRTISHVEYPAKILQGYVQSSIIYKLSPRFNFSVGVAYNYQRNNPNAAFFNEWRPWQQIVYTHNPFKYKGRLSHRGRFEERFIKRQGDHYRFTDRFRYQIGYTVPLQGKTLDPNEFYLNAYNECYFTLSNAKSNPRNAFYSENWTYIGIGYSTKKIGRIEIGPAYQGASRNLNHDRRNLAVLQVMWMTNFNPKKSLN